MEEHRTGNLLPDSHRLSPIQEEESVDVAPSSPINVPPPPVPEQNYNPPSPLPPRTIEREPNRHDEREEYYVKLEKKLMKLYRKEFLDIDTDRTIDDNSNNAEEPTEAEKGCGGEDADVVLTPNATYIHDVDANAAVERDDAIECLDERVYLATNTYAEINLKQEEQRKEIEELLLQKKAVEEQKDKAEALFSEMNQTLKKKDTELNDTKSKLVSTVNMLQTTKLQCSKEKRLKEMEAETKDKLSAQAQEILSVADVATSHVQCLHATVDKLRNVESRNLQVTKTYREIAAQHRSNIASETQHFTKTFVEGLTGLQSAIDDLASNKTSVLQASKMKLQDLLEQIDRTMNEINASKSKLVATTASQRSLFLASLARMESNSAAMNSAVHQLLLAAIQAAQSVNIAAKVDKLHEEASSTLFSLTDARRDFMSRMNLNSQAHEDLLESIQAQKLQTDSLIETLSEKLESDNIALEQRILQQMEDVETERRDTQSRLQTWREEKMRLFEQQLREHCDSKMAALDQRLPSAELSEQPKRNEQESAQNEIIRLKAESLALQERVDKLSDRCRRYEHQIVAQNLKKEVIENVNDNLEHNGAMVPANALMTQEMVPLTCKKEREYLGMFEYKIEDETIIIKKLITDLKPKVAVGLLPGLPAYILFMMLRHMDDVDDEPKMHQLMKAILTGLNNILRKRVDSVEYSCLWLANMLRLRNNLRQYSGDTIYKYANTPRQNQQCLRIFDLSEYSQVLSDVAVCIYRALIHLLERQLGLLIVPAIFEHEEISGVSGPAGRTSGTGPARLKQELTHMHKQLNTFNVYQPLKVMIFKQLFYYISAFSLNQLLLHNDMCCWTKGLQIRNNISHLETWITDHLAEYGQKTVEEILGVLQPITQAVQLLQVCKSMQDVQSTVETCSDLTAMQVCKILNMYTPAEEYEVKATREFVDEIKKKMQEKAGTNPDREPQNLLMDSKMIFSVQFPFNPSPIKLEDVDLPEVLELDGLLTKI